MLKRSFWRKKYASLFTLLFFLVFVVVVESGKGSSNGDKFGFASWAQKFVSKASERLKDIAVAVKDKINGKKKCLYRKSASKYVEEKLQSRLKAQDMAVASIIGSIRSWEFDRSADRRDRSASLSLGKLQCLPLLGRQE